MAAFHWQIMSVTLLTLMTKLVVSGGLLLLMLALAGCSDAPTEPEAQTTTTPQPDEVISTNSTSTSSTTNAPPETIPSEDVPPLAIYLAAIDRGLVDTKFEGDVYLDPESFVSTGRLFCNLLEVGLTPTEVLESYIAALQQEQVEFEDDDLVLGGVILGASVQIICPEFLELVDPESHQDDQTEGDG